MIQEGSVGHIASTGCILCRIVSFCHKKNNDRIEINRGRNVGKKGKKRKIVNQYLREIGK